MNESIPNDEPRRESDGNQLPGQGIAALITELTARRVAAQAVESAILTLAHEYGFDEVRIAACQERGKRAAYQQLRATVQAELGRVAPRTESA